VKELGEQHSLKELRICAKRNRYGESRHDYLPSSLASLRGLDALVGISRPVEKVSIEGVKRAYGERLEKVLMGREMKPLKLGHDEFYDLNALVEEYSWGHNQELFGM
jgi:hypothetical protein